MERSCDCFGMPMDINPGDPFDTLRIFDPETAAAVRTAIAERGLTVPFHQAAQLVELTIWGLAHEVSFGRAVAEGCLALSGPQNDAPLERYVKRVRSAGRRGPTFGKLMAVHLVPVLACRDDALLKRFLETVRIMDAKGTYTLNRPLEVMGSLLASGDRAAVEVYLDALQIAFSADLTYSQCQHFSLMLPRAVLAFPSVKRLRLLEQLRWVLRCDVYLAQPLINGLEKGLHLLSEQALGAFVRQGLEKARRDPELAKNYLSLDSRRGLEAFSQLQVAVSLQEVQARMNRYLLARTGRPLTVRPLTGLSKAMLGQRKQPPLACSDGTFIYLAEEIGSYERRSENLKLYQCLVKLESAYFEFGTFDFDFQKLLEHCPLPLPKPDRDIPVVNAAGARSDLDDFLDRFPDPVLALGLFTIFEHARIFHRLRRCYPGMIREYLPMLRKEARHLQSGNDANDLLTLLYNEAVLEEPPLNRPALTTAAGRCLDEMVALVTETAGNADTDVEGSARRLLSGYPVVERLLQSAGARCRPYDRELRVPFGRIVCPRLVHAANPEIERTAASITDYLNEKGIKVYKSLIRRHLSENRGRISREALAVLVRLSNDGAGAEGGDPDLSDLNLADVPGISDSLPPADGTDGAPASWYKEWDCRLGDYLNAHTRVVDRFLGEHQNDFYRRTLERHRGLVRRVRYSFELIRPEGLKLYRRWVEGDEFDYRALLDFALERKAGKTPSERLYIKRVKEIRDVAVLLLVDLSRSTANAVAGADAAVLDVEKEALVLFCEALEILGDVYAIAGFSGTGRLGVDYFHVKDFNEPMGDAVRNRINAMTPQRNTRMGAAIRHAAAQFDRVAAAVRLLVILGDGYPNDLDYRQRYAVEDTRRAISELRAARVHVHAITINIDPAHGTQLDALYGEIHHNLIADVTELPDKLLRIYGALTRS
jgi:nitric oxide reductase NorD protein